MYLRSACLSEIQWHDHQFAAGRRFNDTSHLLGAHTGRF
jgi:hypothetical protein